MPEVVPLKTRQPAAPDEGEFRGLIDDGSAFTDRQHAARELQRFVLQVSLRGGTVSEAEALAVVDSIISATIRSLAAYLGPPDDGDGGSAA